MKNFLKTSVDSNARTELHDILSLSGAEISINHLPQGASVPFVHAHKQNEEIYGILAGKGKAEIDGECIPLSKGDWIHVFPQAKRRFFAAEDEGICFVCIQVKANSLQNYTMDDAIAY